MASKRYSRLFKILAGAFTDAEEVFQLEGRLERFAHFWALVVRQFIRYRGFVRASALSFSTLLALIPLIAVALSVTSSLLSPQQEAALSGFVEQLAASVAPPVNLATNAPPVNGVSTNGWGAIPPDALADTNGLAAEMLTNPPPVAVATVNPQNQVAQEIHHLVQTASNRTLGSIGLFLLALTAISLLRGIEETFNDLWGVTRGRSWWLQFVFYWFIITFGPLVLSAALGVPLGLHFEGTRHFLECSPGMAPLIKHVLPVVFLSGMLGLFYQLTPNTKVELSAAMVGGLWAGVAWHLYNQLGFLLLSRALNASKYYGGLALVVLVMGGLYVLWLILLFGGQIAYAWQNRAVYLQDRLAENVNQRGREFVALRIMTSLGRRFQLGQPPATVPEISTELGVPSRLTQSILRTLAATRLVAEAAGTEAAFLPARPLETISADDILLAMRTGAGQELPVTDTPELAEIYGEFARIEQAERVAAARITLQALANRLTPRAELPPAEKMPAPEPVALPKPDPFPESADAPEPAGLAAERSEPPRREPARPDEHRDFPL